MARRHKAEMGSRSLTGSLAVGYTYGSPVVTTNSSFTTIQMAFTANGDPSDYDDAKKTKIAQAIAYSAGVSPSAVEVTVVAGSVVITVVITIEASSATSK